jgi:PAS domain S-box-containing protein
MTLDGIFTYHSPSVMGLRGYTAEEAACISLEQTLTPGSHALVREFFIGELGKPPGEQWMPHALELEMYRKDGSTLWTEVMVRAIKDEEGNVTGLQGSTRDITEKKQIQENVSASLKEKEILLRELHHRVKNNMQVITSLLRLQCRHVKDEHMIELFNESQNRIKSMALVHEKLYRSRDLACVDVRSYIETLGSHLARSYGKKAIRIIYDIDEVKIDVEGTIPLGLIINEIVSILLMALTETFSKRYRTELVNSSREKSHIRPRKV